jgi:hypothetical protein
MSQHVMVDPLTLGAQYQLGNHKATYQPRMLTRQDIVVSAVLVVFISLIFIIIMFISMPSFTNKIVGSIIIASYVLLFGTLNWNIYRKQALRLFAYEDGLIYIGRKSSPTIIYWQRVQSIVHKVKVTSSEYGSSTRDIYTLKCTDGTSLRLDDGTFQGLGQLITSIKIKTAR